MIDADTALEIRALGAEPHEVPLERRGLNPVADLRYYRALRKLIRLLGPDVVIGYTAKPNIWGSLAARAERVLSVSMVTGLGYAFVGDTGIIGGAVRGVMRRLYRAATACNYRVVFQNPDDQSDFVAANCLTDTGKVVLVNGSGVDIDYFAPVPLPSPPVFLLIARLLWAKGIAEYVEAARSVRAQLPDARFQLVGFLESGLDGASEGDLRQWEREGIEYLGELADVRPAIAGCSVYVLPSYREGTPRTVLEAMSMGRPIITTDAPGCRETTIDGGNGLLVQVADAGSLAAAMVRLARDPDLRVRMGRRSREIAKERFGDENVAADLTSKLGLCS